MSILDSFYNSELTIKRPATITGSKTTSRTAIASGIACVVIPITDKEQLFTEGNIGKEFKILTSTTTEPKSGDLLEIGSKVYGVVGVSFYEDFEGGDESHYEIRGVIK